MNKQPLIVYGTHDFAKLIRYYFDHDSAYEVVGFTIDRQYQQGDSFCELPVVPFEQVEQVYPPAETAMFVAVGYRNLNQLREKKCCAARSKGYQLATYISSRASAWPDLVIGDNCFMMEQVVIQPFVKIGDGVTAWAAAHISHDCLLGDYSFMAAHAVLGGYDEVGKRCFFGMNSVVKDHVTVADDCLIGAGACLLENAPSGSVYVVDGTKRATFGSRLAKNFL